MLTQLPGPGPEGETAMDANGFITQLKQAISLPTVQRDRVLNHWEFWGAPHRARFCGLIINWDEPQI